MNYISIQSLNDVIEHYGIKGMRWGIKSRSPVVRSEASQYKNMKALVKEMKKAGMVTKR